MCLFKKAIEVRVLAIVTPMPVTTSRFTLLESVHNINTGESFSTIQAAIDDSYMIFNKNSSLLTGRSFTEDFFDNVLANTLGKRIR